MAAGAIRTASRIARSATLRVPSDARGGSYDEASVRRGPRGASFESRLRNSVQVGAQASSLAQMPLPAFAAPTESDAQSHKGTVEQMLLGLLTQYKATAAIRPELANGVPARVMADPIVGRLERGNQLSPKELKQVADELATLRAVLERTQKSSAPIKPAELMEGYRRTLSSASDPQQKLIAQHLSHLAEDMDASREALSDLRDMAQGSTSLTRSQLERLDSIAGDMATAAASQRTAERKKSTREKLEQGERQRQDDGRFGAGRRESEQDEGLLSRVAKGDMLGYREDLTGSLLSVVGLEDYSEQIDGYLQDKLSSRKRASAEKEAAEKAAKAGAPKANEGAPADGKSPLPSVTGDSTGDATAAPAAARPRREASRVTPSLPTAEEFSGDVPVAYSGSTSAAELASTAVLSIPTGAAAETVQPPAASPYNRPEKEPRRAGQPSTPAGGVRDVSIKADRVVLDGGFTAPAAGNRGAPSGRRTRERRHAGRRMGGLSQALSLTPMALPTSPQPPQVPASPLSSSAVVQMHTLEMRLLRQEMQLFKRLDKTLRAIETSLPRRGMLSSLADAGGLLGGAATIADEVGDWRRDKGRGTGRDRDLPDPGDRRRQGTKGGRVRRAISAVAEGVRGAAAGVAGRVSDTVQGTAGRLRGGLPGSGGIVDTARPTRAPGLLGRVASGVGGAALSAGGAIAGMLGLPELPFDLGGSQDDGPADVPNRAGSPASPDAPQSPPDARRPAAPDAPTPRRGVMGRAADRIGAAGSRLRGAVAGGTTRVAGAVRGTLGRASSLGARIAGATAGASGAAGGLLSSAGTFVQGVPAKASAAASHVGAAASRIGPGAAALGKGALGAAKFIPVAGQVLAAGMAVSDAVGGWNRAGENFGLAEGQEATTGQKAASAAGSLVSGLTFGLVDEEALTKGIHGAGSAVTDFLGIDDSQEGTAQTPPEAAPVEGGVVTSTSPELGMALSPAAVAAAVPPGATAPARTETASPYVTYPAAVPSVVTQLPAAPTPETQRAQETFAAYKKAADDAVSQAQAAGASAHVSSKAGAIAGGTAMADGTPAAAVAAATGRLQSMEQLGGLAGAPITLGAVGGMPLGALAGAGTDQPASGGPGTGPANQDVVVAEQVLTSSPLPTLPSLGAAASAIAAGAGERLSGISLSGSTPEAISQLFTGAPLTAAAAALGSASSSALTALTSGVAQLAPSAEGSTPVADMASRVLGSAALPLTADNLFAATSRVLASVTGSSPLAQLGVPLGSAADTVSARTVSAAGSLDAGLASVQGALQSSFAAGTSPSQAAASTANAVGVAAIEGTFVPNAVGSLPGVVASAPAVLTSVPAELETSMALPPAIQDQVLQNDTVLSKVVAQNSGANGAMVGGNPAGARPGDSMAASRTRPIAVPSRARTRPAEPGMSSFHVDDYGISIMNSILFD